MSDAPFHFVCLDSNSKSLLDDTTFSRQLCKWSMKGYLRLQRYSFNEPFQLYQKQDFAEAFFRDPCVLSTLRVYSSDSPTPLRCAAAAVEVRRVPCSLTSTALLHRLRDVGVVRGEGLIAGCAETLVDDIVVNDRLRKVLVDEDDEDWAVFSEGERAELLLRLLRLLVVGGRWCQYEDTIEPYVEAVRALYKDLVSVEMNPDGVVAVRSVVLAVTARDADGRPLLPLHPDHPQDVALLCVDPARRTVSVLSHHYGEGLVE